MNIKKKGDSFDTYLLEISFTEMAAILTALEADHTGPVGDEVFAALKWYVSRLPEPGSEETKLKHPEADEKEEVITDIPEPGDEEVKEESLKKESIEDEFKKLPRTNPSAGQCPNCWRPKPAHERVCAHCRNSKNDPAYAEKRAKKSPESLDSTLPEPPK